MKRLLNNKKGAEMTISTIIFIILALVVLVVLVVGFTQGWGNLWSWLTNLFNPGGVNIDAVLSGCKSACTTASQTGYCIQVRDVKFPTELGLENGKYNCRALEEKNIPGVESCGQFVECPKISPSCKPKQECAQFSTKDATAKGSCESIGCYFDNADPSKAPVCKIADGQCDIQKTKEACAGAISSKICSWK
jgi:hypothetical protein